MTGDAHVWGENHADPAHVERVAGLVEAAAGSGSERVVVGIDGPAGSGKSSLAALLGARLHAPVLHTDDLLPGWDGPAALPALLTVQVLVPLRRDEPCGYRRFDWHADAYADWVPVPPVPVLLVEGCGCTAAPAADLLDVRVWLEAGQDERMRRGLSRDGDGFAGHWQSWAAAERSLFTADGTRSRAHLTLRTDTEQAHG